MSWIRYFFAIVLMALAIACAEMKNESPTRPSSNNPSRDTESGTEASQVIETSETFESHLEEPDTQILPMPDTQIQAAPLGPDTSGTSASSANTRILYEQLKTSLYGPSTCKSCHPGFGT